MISSVTVHWLRKGNFFLVLKFIWSLEQRTYCSKLYLFINLKVVKANFLLECK